MKNLMMHKNCLFATANITLNKNQMLLVKGGKEDDDTSTVPLGPVGTPPVVPDNGDKLVKK